MQNKTVVALFLVTLSVLPNVPTSAHALNFQITAGETITTLDSTAVTIIDGKRAIQLAPPPGSGSTTYGNVTISSCTMDQGCSGNPARVFVEDGASVDKIVLTDAVIRANVTNASVTITMQSDPGDFEILLGGKLLPGGNYPYAASANGLFQGIGARSDRLELSAFANADNMSGPKTLIKSGGSTVEPSLAVPGFNSFLTASFAPPTPAEQIAIIPCGTEIIGFVEPRGRGVRHANALRIAPRVQRLLGALGRSRSPFGLLAPTWRFTPDEIIPVQFSPDCQQSLQAVLVLTFKSAGDRVRLPNSIAVYGATTPQALVDALAFPDKWTLDPPQQTVAISSVRSPINVDGSRVFNARRGAIPIQFDLAVGPGPAVLESIRSDSDTSNDISSLTFTPGFDAGGGLPRTKFSDITTLKADYMFAAGNCAGGSLRWEVVIDPFRLGDPFDYKTIRILYGKGPATSDFGCTGSASQSGTNLIEFTDARYDAFDVTGNHTLLTREQVLTTSTSALTPTIGNSSVVRASLVLESPPNTASDLMLNLDGAMVVRTLTTGSITDTFEPQSGVVQTCDLPPASIRIGKASATSDDFVDIATITSIQSDTGTEFRIVDCKYIYNLDVQSLSGPGQYKVEVVIDDVDPIASGMQPLVAKGAAFFGLK